jgi:large subunit ribosomal protein L30
MARKLKVTQVHSTIGRTETQRATIRGLGLGKLMRTVVVDDTPSMRGMIKKVIHLVRVEEIDA